MNNREPELRVADLLAMLLKAFVPILCAVLIAGLLGCALGFLRAPSVTEAELAAAEAEADRADAAYLSTERAVTRQNEIELPDAERRMQENEAIAAQRRAYLENSLFQKLNAFHCGVSRVTVSLAPEDVAAAAAFADSCPHDAALLQALRTALQADVEDAYIWELVQVRLTANALEIAAFHEDPATAQRMTDTLLASLSEKRNGAAPDVVDSFVGYETNLDIYAVQTDRENSRILAENATEEARLAYDTLLDTRKERDQSVADAKLAYEEALAQRNALAAQYAQSAPNLLGALKSAVLYGVIGAAAGLVLACVIVWIATLLNGRLHNRTEAQSLFACPLIGVLPRVRRVPFRNAVQTLEGDPKGPFPAQAQAALQCLSRLTGDRKVCLISTLGTAAADRLAPHWNGVPAAGDLLTDANAIDALDAFDAVVLIEQRDRSRTALIDAEIARAELLGKPVVGIVLL